MIKKSVCDFGNESFLRNFITVFFAFGENIYPNFNAFMSVFQIVYLIIHNLLLFLFVRVLLFFQLYRLNLYLIFK